MKKILCCIFAITFAVLVNINIYAAFNSQESPDLSSQNEAFSADLLQPDDMPNASGDYDYSYVDLSDTTNMTFDEAVNYLSEIYGEPSSVSDDYVKFSDGHYNNVRIYRFSYRNVDRPNYIEMSANTSRHTNEEDYQPKVLGNIRLAMTYGQIMDICNQCGYKYDIVYDPFIYEETGYASIEPGVMPMEAADMPSESSKMVTYWLKEMRIGNGSNAIRFYFRYHKYYKDSDGNEHSEDLTEEEINSQRIYEMKFYGCQDDAYSNDHPEHDYSYVKLEDFLGLSSSDGYNKMCELFGAETVSKGSRSISVEHDIGEGHKDGFYFSAYYDDKDTIYLISLVSFDAYHLSLKPQLTDSMPAALTVHELKELAVDLNAEISEDDRKGTTDLEGAKSISYIFSLDDIIVTYTYENYKRAVKGYEITPEDELDNCLVPISQLERIKKYTLYDANDDGDITLDDAIVTLKAAMNVSESSDSLIDEAADANGDGEITLDDAIKILKVAMNVIE